MARDGEWGAHLRHGTATFRVWAPDADAIGLHLNRDTQAMQAVGGGWWQLARPAEAGDRYHFLVDGAPVTDPAARAVATGLRGDAVVVDPRAYRWRAQDWRGRPWAEAVIAEIHVGTFTEAGTFREAAERLPALADAGYTAVELMPVAQFEGAHGWGYDGVLLYAPHHAYGTPEDVKALIDRAHELGLMVFLDVVYNHFGPEGNPLPRLAPAFFHPERHTPWGVAIAYERPPVRRFFVENALMWLGEYRFDGLRFDAADHVRDDEAEEEILAEMAREIRATFPDREIHLATEDNRNITRLHPWDGGRPLLHTAEWNDDLHNVAHVVATGETEGYYTDFAEDRWGKLARALAEGFAYQGEESRHGGAPRGVPSGGQPPLAFVDFLQNHDQVGNRAFGERLTVLAPRPLLRALTALHLLAPHVPLLFMGQEWGETRPFVFFTDFEGELADAVREGRRKEFEHFAAFRDKEARSHIPDPNDPTSFEASRIDWTARETDEGRDWLDFTRALLEVRAREVVPLLAGAPGHGGRVIAADDGLIAVDWRLDGATLAVRANLGETPREAPGAPGRRIWGEGDGPLAPFCVRAVVAA